MENQYANSLLSKLSNIPIPTTKELEDIAINSFVRTVIDSVSDLVNSKSKCGKFETLLTVFLPPNIIKFETHVKSNIINELSRLGFKASIPLIFKSNNEWNVYVSWAMDSPSNSTISKYIEASMESLLNLTVERIKKASSLGENSTGIPTGDTPYSPVLTGVIVKILTDKGYTVTTKEGMCKIDISW